jgi:spermidine synthase
LLLLFSISLFLSALLLFVIQPLFGKMVLPLLGGSPAVWNTCMAFFQALLLLGYAYTHYSTKWLGIKQQFFLHLVLFISVLFFLPVTVSPDWAPSSGAQPVWHLLKMLAILVGLPFFVVSTSAPLLQKWFAGTAHGRAQDPYFLYSASNAGSLVGLLGYLILGEPYFSLFQLSWVWSFSFGLLMILVILCGLTLHRALRRAVVPGGKSPAEVNSPNHLSAEGQEPTGSIRLKWLLWSFCPSSLMLGVTNFITTDIAAVPLFWVIPLTLYLLSFIIVFARRPIIPFDLSIGVHPFLLLPLGCLFLWNLAGEGLWVLPLHFLTFFIVALVCHGRLAQSRPSTAFLTEFYLWMAVGGVLGGAFNAFIAPVLFNQMTEYPLVLALAAFLYPRNNPDLQRKKPKWFINLCLGLLGLVLIYLAAGKVVRIVNQPGLSLVISVIVTLICLRFISRPLLFGSAITCLILSSVFFSPQEAKVLFSERNFFGLLQVKSDAEYRYFYHGTTVHGGQSTDPSRRKDAVPYYAASGPIGQVFKPLSDKKPSARVAIVGLGAGGLASYASAGQNWTFYEIDPTVIRLATSPSFFTFLKDCPAKWNIVSGDARLTLAKAPDDFYDLIVLDAFNSDAVPIHLMNREALKIYLRKLAPGGMIVFNVCNRFLELGPILGNLAYDAGIEGRSQFHSVSTEEQNRYYGDTYWVIMGRKTDDLDQVADKERWRTLLPQLHMGIWNDNYSNILSAFIWPEWDFLKKLGL